MNDKFFHILCLIAGVIGVSIGGYIVEPNQLDKSFFNDLTFWTIIGEAIFWIFMHFQKRRILKTRNASKIKRPLLFII